MNPRAIGLDIYRNIPEPPGTETLEQVFKNTPNLIGIQKIVGKKGEQAVDPPPVLKSKDQVCSNDLIIDSDNIIRRALLNLSDDKKQTIYSFAACLAYLYLEKEKSSFQAFKWKFSNRQKYIYTNRI
jgi:adenylate cyclase